MKPQAPVTFGLLRRIQRRLVMRQLMLSAGLGASLAAVAAGMSIVAARTLDHYPWGFASTYGPKTWAIPCAGVVLGGTLLGAAYAWWRRPSLRHAAWLADQSLGSHDALGITVDLANSDRAAGVIEQLHLATAEQHALRCDPRIIVSFRPVRRAWSTRVLPAAMAMLVAAGVLMPAFPGWRVALTPEAFGGASVSPVDADAVRSVAASVAAATASLPDATSREIESIRAVESELAGTSLADRHASQRVAAAAEQVADRLETAADQARQREHAVRQELQRRLGRSDSAQHGDLSTAMSAGDLEAAARAASELAQQASRLPADRRLQAARELSKLADSLQRSPRSDAQDTSDTRIKEQMEAISRLARDAAKELQQPPESPAAAPAASPGPSAAGDTRESKSAATQRQPASEASSSEKSPGTHPESSGSSPPAESIAQPQPAPTNPTQDPAKPEGTRTDASDRRAASDDNKKGNAGGIQGDRTAPSEPSESGGARGSTPYRTRSEQGAAPTSRETPRSDRTTTPVNPERGTSTPQGEGREQESGQSRSQEGQRSESGSGSSGSERQNATQRLAQTLERMSESADKSRRMEGESRSLREQARELLERMKGSDEADASRKPGDESGREAPGAANGEGANSGEAEHGGTSVGRTAGGGVDRTGRGEAGTRISGPTEAARPFVKPRDLEHAMVDGVDARPLRDDDASSRVVAEWETSPSPANGAGARTAAGIAGGVTQAAKSAERAIDAQQVPTQYGDLVRRVFKRYLQRASPDQH